MMRSRTLAISAWILAALFLIATLVIIFIPTGDIQGALVGALARKGYTLRCGYFGKAFPLGVKARNVEIGDARGTLLKLDTASARISFLPLCVGRVAINYRGEIGKGSMEGHFSPQQNMRFSLKLNDVQLQDIPFFRTATGARVSGNLKSNADFRGVVGNYRGEVRLSVKNAVLNGVKIGQTPLPDASFEAVQGLYRVNGTRGTLESFTLQGRGIYVRLKGEIPFTSPMGSAPINLTLELMPKPVFLENQKFVFLLLSKYLTTPGHYQLPVRGTLAKPAIQ
ncbi:MAG: hypothetical protein H6Q57_1074 [Geobacteraceae bacterium]|nr:hypothetical protein [Geobacteraceae bacterium]